MSRPFQLSRPFKVWLYALFGVLFLSGALWWLADFAAQRRWANLEINSFKAWILRAHGASAMGFLFVWGALFPVHAYRAWRAGQNRFTGMSLMLWLAALTITGYGLYYFGGERLREWTSLIHTILGLASVAVLFIHIRQGHRTAASD